MTDYSELKRLAERVIDIEALDGGEPIGEAWGEFEAAATPAAVLALIAEVEALFSQVATLQSAANSWQSGYDEGRRIGTKTALDERDQLRKDAERWRFFNAVANDLQAFPHSWGLMTKEKMDFMCDEAMATTSKGAKTK